MLRSVEVYLRHTPQGEFLRTAKWGWPIFESLHFLGMSMLLGTVGVFDLRLLGFARRIPIAALHRLIPIGIAGFVINLRHRLLLSLGNARSVPVQSRVSLEGHVHRDCRPERDDLLRARVPASARDCRRTPPPPLGGACRGRRLTSRVDWRDVCRAAVDVFQAL